MGEKPVMIPFVRAYGAHSQTNTNPKGGFRKRGEYKGRGVNHR
jgi:hypothetical protein